MDDLLHIIHVLRQHPRSRVSVLNRLAERAKADLRGIPAFKKTPAWRSTVAAHEASGHCAEGLRPPSWMLDSGEGACGVAGLQQFLSTYEHKDAAKWRAAANQLRLCLLYSDDPENMIDTAILNLIVAVMDCDRQVGHRRRAQMSDFARRGPDGCDPVLNAEQVKARYAELLENPRLSDHGREQIIVTEMGGSRSTVRRMLGK